MVPAYNIVFSAQTLAQLLSYQSDLAMGKATAGGRLQKELVKKQVSALSPQEFLHALLATKLPRIFAESEIMGDGSDWTHRELALLGDINVAMPVSIFDNGTWSPNDATFETFDPPRQGHLLFTPGALLTGGDGFDGTPPDLAEIRTQDGDIDTEKYNALVMRRILPLLAHANATAEQEGVPAFIAIPGIGCGQFAGDYKGEMGAHLNTALKTLLAKHAATLPHIAGIYYDPFSECDNEDSKIGHIHYIVRPALKNAGLPQLSDPQSLGGADFKNHRLYKIVAWDHVSLPGNDFYMHARATDDGVAAASTDTMTKITGENGHYTDAKYLPLTPGKTWEDIAHEKNIRLSVQNNVYIVNANGQIKDISTAIKAVRKPPTPPRL